MRADRLISIVLMLQSHGRMTAKQLADRLEVSERTIYRDMQALSGAGIPVIADRGVGGGWRLLEEYRTNLTGLKETEIKALFVSPSGQLLDDLGLTRTAEDARNKLLASLPAASHDTVKDVWERIHIDTSAWRKPKEKLVSFETLQQAVWDEKKLKLRYRRADSSMTERIVEPLGLVAKGSVWYLVAAVDETVRTYRVSRIQSATLIYENFTRPQDFSLAQYWKSSTQAFVDNLPEFDIHVVAAPSIFSKLKYTGRFVQIRTVGTPDDNGWIPVTVRVDTEQEAKELILGFGNSIKVLEPRYLVDEVVKMARDVIALYDTR